MHVYSILGFTLPEPIVQPARKSRAAHRVRECQKLIEPSSRLRPLGRGMGEQVCMRGTVQNHAGTTICEGRWFLPTDPKRKSEFKYQSVAASGAFPASGAYDGYFKMLKTTHRENALHLEFIGRADHTFVVRGHGSNEFGEFSVEGTVSAAVMGVTICLLHGIHGLMSMF